MVRTNWHHKRKRASLEVLKDLSSPHVTVIRDGKETVIANSDLVLGDLMMIYEGVKTPADGIVIKCNDLCVDESSLTSEAEGVWKMTTENAEQCRYCALLTNVNGNPKRVLLTESRGDLAMKESFPLPGYACYKELVNVGVSQEQDIDFVEWEMWKAVERLEKSCRIKKKQQ